VRCGSGTGFDVVYVRVLQGHLCAVRSIPLVNFALHVLHEFVSGTTEVLEGASALFRVGLAHQAVCAVAQQAQQVLLWRAHTAPRAALRMLAGLTAATRHTAGAVVIVFANGVASAPAAAASLGSVYAKAGTLALMASPALASVLANCRASTISASPGFLVVWAEPTAAGRHVCRNTDSTTCNDAIFFNAVVYLNK